MAPGRRSRLDLDVYLLPAIVGGGRGDITETADAGTRLARAGARVRIFREPDRPLPAEVASVLAGYRFPRTSRLPPGGRRALTVAPMWGVSAAPARAGPLGRPGPWAAEVEAIEAAYGPGRVVHVSLEEFARTLTVREETLERYREGGLSRSEARRRWSSPEGRREAEVFRAAYRRFRAFERPNLVHLFAAFAPAPTFSREHSEAIVVGPLWPDGPRASARVRGNPRPTWVWYASPSSSDVLVAPLAQGLGGSSHPVRLVVRSPRPGWPSPRPDGWTVSSRPLPRAAWRRDFERADVRIVTGSRSLLEALEVGGPFLYFNGLSGSGRGRRRHRPEKIRSLIAAGRREGRSEAGLNTLDAFSRGRRVADIARRLARGGRLPGAFPPGWRPSGFRPPFDDAGGLLVEIARRWGRTDLAAGPFVAGIRAGTRRGRIGLGPRSGRYME